MAGVKWVEGLLWGGRERSAFARGGGESARAKGGAWRWERVVEDGGGCELVNGDRAPWEKCKPDEKAQTRQRRRVETKCRPGYYTYTGSQADR